MCKRSLTTRSAGPSPYLLLICMAKRGVEVRRILASRSSGQKVTPPSPVW